MRVFIAGVDGYIGWALAMYLASKGHEVAGADCYHRRDWVAEIGSQSATPIKRMTERLQAFRENFGTNLQFIRGDMTDYNFVWNFFRTFQPEAVVHLAEMPSAPYSMMDVHHCTFTHTNNLLGTINILFAMRDTCPESHLVKLGTMGEYGTPNIDIPEGFFEIDYRGRKDKLPFPRQAGSWYHQTKVHDTNNVNMACRIWGLRSTDIMQGVVFGTTTDEMGEDERLLTRFDFDQCFGTAINRFCAQAVIGEALTLFGKGHQKRGFLSLRDSIQCLGIAIENPPVTGEYRVFNQFEEVYDLTELALKVQKVAGKCGLTVEVSHVENPRKELEEHYFNPDHQHLLDLGYKPNHDIEGVILEMLNNLMNYKNRIKARSHALIPDIRWDGTRKKVSFVKTDHR
jgi:UDP-sulfoquinovose synthase